MFNKNNRLAKDADIKAVFAKGRGFFNPFFNVKYLRKAAGKRFTVVVSTKVYKSAVKRNRLKRIAREFLKKNLQNLGIGDYIIIAKPKINTVKDEGILPALTETFKKIK